MPARRLVDSTTSAFVAAVENGPLVALQLRPESSGDAGATVLARWVSSLPSTAPEITGVTA